VKTRSLYLTCRGLIRHRDVTPGRTDGQTELRSLIRVKTNIKNNISDFFPEFFVVVVNTLFTSPFRSLFVTCPCSYVVTLLHLKLNSYHSVTYIRSVSARRTQPKIGTFLTPPEKYVSPVATFCAAVRLTFDFRRNRSSASDSSDTFLRSMACHIRAPFLNCLTDLHAIWQVHLWGPMTHCVGWLSQGKQRFRGRTFRRRCNCKLPLPHGE